MAYLSLFFHVIAFLLCHAILATNHTDQLALLAIKSSITHDPQHVFDSWNISLHFCQWQGVTCGRRHQRVIKLDLVSSGIVGSLSPQIGNMSFLGVISLGNNTFEGVIPSQIGGLFRLQRLILANNSFEGELPASLSNCTRLKQLSVGGNKLCGRLPPQLSSLVNLVILSIYNNGFTGEIPPFLGNLTSLKVLSAANNHLGGSIPHALGQLHNLQKIGFPSCQLHGEIPSSLYNLTSLEIFSFPDNQISGNLPKDIGLKLQKLELFQIGSNKFTGTIPISFSNCSNLVDFNLGENLFNGEVNINFRKMPNLQSFVLSGSSLGSSQPHGLSFIDSMTNCSKLEQLVVRDAQLTGVIPRTVGNLSSHITLLSFGGNYIYGNLPSGIGNLQKLEKLTLEYNQFTGIIPNELGNLQNLKVFSISYNNFTGMVPNFLGNFSLLYLDMSCNKLEGKIPVNLGNCKTLTSLDLSKNNLTGPIPLELFQLSSLTTALFLNQNHLVGSLPQEIEKLKSLTELDLLQNDMDGTIPDAIRSCTSLEYLSLASNSFQGPIPSSMSDLRGIRILLLSSNNLSGQIPRFLEQLNLSSLNLSFNNFYGEVPVKGIFKNTSAFAIEGNGRLCGGLLELGLPKCAMLTRSKNGSYALHVVLVVVPLCSFLVVVIFFLYFCSRRRRRALPIEASPMQPFSRVSYGSLFKATNGFSEKNRIGAGAFGVVYKGLFEPDGIMVAIKVLRLESQGALRSFIAECEALKNIRHRNLVKIITSCSSVDFQENDFKALIYEYMPNGNLNKWLHPSSDLDTQIKKAPQILTLCQRLAILTDVAHAIHYLHQESKVPILHCDLKPSNILLDSEMVAHISDFGMAKLLPLKPNESSSIGIPGTIGYAAPEYGLGSEMAKEGDIYSFGILLLEMITGKKPTDLIFEEGLNLHVYVKKVFPDHFMRVIDPSLLHILEKEMEVANINLDYSEDEANKWNKLEESMIALGRIGLACSMESPKDRINASKIIHELHHISSLVNLILPC